MDQDILPTQIRVAGIQDAALLAEIGRRAFFEAFAEENDPANMAAYLDGAFSPEIQAAELAQPGSVFFILEWDGQPAGFMRLLDAPHPDCVQAGRPLELVRIYVLRPWLGHGLGGQLMQRCIDYAQLNGYDAIWLSVWTKNPRAVAFYRKWGYEIAGYATFTVGDDVQQDYIMVRQV